MFKLLTESVSEVLSAPLTMAASAADLTIKIVESVPTITEKTIEKIENSFDNIGE